MALTEAQIDTVFEIIDIPRSTTVEQPVGDMGLTGQTFQESNQEFQLQIKIESRIASLSSSNQTKLIAYVDRWDDIGTQSWTMDAGAIGNTSGMTMSPQVEGAEIQRRVKRIIGVYRIIDEIRNQTTKSGGTFIPVIN